MKCQNRIALFSALFFLLASCGTDNLKPDNAIKLNGPIAIKYKLSNQDSLIHKNGLIKVSYDMPDSIVTNDGIVIKNIVDAKLESGFYSREIKNNNAYFGESPNFTTGISTGKYGAAIRFSKGVYHWEDTYTCRDTGVFWFNFVPQSVGFRFWTSDGKEYVIPITDDFDVPDRHTEMLLRYAPSLSDQIDYEQSLGFGHYCFKVVP